MKAPSLSVAVSQNPSLVFENNLRKEIELDRILSQDQKESRLKCKVSPILLHSIHFFNLFSVTNSSQCDLMVITVTPLLRWGNRTEVFTCFYLV